jgi:hypothetical protein
VRASEMLDGALAELTAGRHNNAVNRSYYACFHIGVCLRILAGDQPERVDPSDGRFLWAHSGTMSRLRQLMNTHSLPSLVPAPTALLLLRLHADYYADEPASGVSLEAATGFVTQVTRLRESTLNLLPWPKNEDK